MQLEETVKQHIEQDGKIHAKLDLALFGDKELGIKGMTEKVDELYEIFTAGGNIKKAIVWILAATGAVIGAAYTIIRIYKDLQR